MQRNKAKTSGFAVVKKASSQWKKFFWKKKNGSEKLFFTTKLLLKRKQQKINKIPHIILEEIIWQIISQSFCKIELNPKELELGLLD